MGTGVSGLTYRATADVPLVEMVPVLLAEVCAAIGVDGTAEGDDDGRLRVYVGADVRMRSYSDAREGVLLIEVTARTSADCFELFLVPNEDGHLRAGWRRPWAPDDTAPVVWVVVESHVQLHGQVQPQVDPDFAVLLAALFADGQPRIDYEDANARASLAADLTHLRDTVDRQAEQLRKLQYALASRSADVEHAIAAPAAQREWRLSDLAEWADLHADEITVLPRAIAEAKKSVLVNQELVFEALGMLATTYRAVKLSMVSRDELKARADQLGLFLGGSVQFAGEYGDAYFVQHGGRRRLLDQHIGRGSSRDPRYSLRIYYFWDDDAQRVVVGWLPSHLPNSLS